MTSYICRRHFILLSLCNLDELKLNEMSTIAVPVIENFNDPLIKNGPSMYLNDKKWPIDVPIKTGTPIHVPHFRKKKRTHSSSTERRQTWFWVLIFFFFFALSNTCTRGWNTHYARVSGPQKALSAWYARVSGQCSTDDLAVRRNHWIDGRVSRPHLRIVPALAGHT